MKVLFITNIQALYFLDFRKDYRLLVVSIFHSIQTITSDICLIHTGVYLTHKGNKLAKGPPRDGWFELTGNILHHMTLLVLVNDY